MKLATSILQWAFFVKRTFSVVLDQCFQLSSTKILKVEKSQKFTQILFYWKKYFICEASSQLNLTITLTCQFFPVELILKVTSLSYFWWDSRKRGAITKGYWVLRLHTNTSSMGYLLKNCSKIVIRNAAFKYKALWSESEGSRSNHTRRSAGLRDPTSLRGSLWPSGRIWKTQVINIGWVRLPPR